MRVHARRQYPAPALDRELQAATVALADLQVIVQRCSAAVRRPVPPCRHHLRQLCWFGPAGIGCNFQHGGGFNSSAVWRGAPPPSPPSPPSSATGTPRAPRRPGASPSNSAKSHSKPHPTEPCCIDSPRVAASPKTRERLKDTLEELADNELDDAATIEQIVAK